MLKVMVIDGQGGGVGKAVIEKIKQNFAGKVKISAFGTNAVATSVMHKAGADESATGENAIVFNAPKADVIIGAIGIIASCSMLGELTPAMARAVSESEAVKILIPINKCNLLIAGTRDAALSALISDALAILGDIIEGN